MGCERCGGTIERYRLQGREALVCESCGYVDVPVEHGGESGPSESWDEAFERFYEKAGERPGSSYPVRPVSPDDVSDESIDSGGTDDSSPTVDGDETGCRQESDDSPELGDAEASDRSDGVENGDGRHVDGAGEAGETVLSLNGVDD